MTEDEKAGCIARPIREYSATKEEIALLREHLAEDGRRLESLGEQLRRNPMGVEVGENRGADFQLRAYGAAEPRTVPPVDPEKVRLNLIRLRQTPDEKAALEKRLQNAGLGNPIGD